MKKLPKIYKNDISHEIKNNKDMVYVKSNEEEFIKENNEMSIDEKITTIFNSNRHIFNIPIEIVTKDKKYSTYIAGKMRDCIITLDNDVIKIDDIIDIREKNINN